MHFPRKSLQATLCHARIYLLGEKAMHVPKIEERSIVRRATRKRIMTAVKEGKYLQHWITLPKKFGDSLKAEGVNSLHVLYGQKVLIAFPETVDLDGLIALLKLHFDLERLAAKEEA